ncbi:MAG TPA: hypothetical protein PLI96_11350 [Halothiobacillus sp.]|nr:hypothetical protein [Halothiobacillus sp.]
MNYPEIDSTVIDEATAARDKILAAKGATQAAISDAEAGINAASLERERLIDLAARGESVPAEKTADNEAALRENEAELLRQRDILSRQERLVGEAEAKLRTARGLAHHLRVAAALVEMRDGGEEKSTALRAVRRADDRVNAAKAVLAEAWGAGFPAAQGIARGYMAPAEFDRAFFTDLSEQNLRRLWGAIAEKAFGPMKPAEAA